MKLHVIAKYVATKARDLHLSTLRCMLVKAYNEVAAANAVESDCLKALSLARQRIVDSDIECAKVREFCTYEARSYN